MQNNFIKCFHEDKFLNTFISSWCITCHITIALEFNCTEKSDFRHLALNTSINSCLLYSLPQRITNRKRNMIKYSIANCYSRPEIYLTCQLFSLFLFKHEFDPFHVMLFDFQLRFSFFRLLLSV